MNNTMNYMDPSGTAITIIIIALALAICTYIFLGIGLYKIAKNNNYETQAFYAWIPILNIYLMGVIAGEDGRTGYTGKQLALFYIIVSLFSWIPVLGFILALLGTAAFIVILLDIFDRLDEENAVILTILSAFIPLAQAIIFYIHRNNTLKS